MTRHTREQLEAEADRLCIREDALLALGYTEPTLIVVSRSEVLARAQRDLTRSYGRTFAVPACLSSTRRRIGRARALWGVGVCCAVCVAVLVLFVGGLGR